MTDVKQRKVNNKLKRIDNLICRARNIYKNKKTIPTKDIKNLIIKL